MAHIVKIKSFAKTIAQILKSDRWVFMVIDGDMGEGKSCFATKLSPLVANFCDTHFSYKDNMTYSRKELNEWIDGDEKGKNQKPEYSVILADEIVSMFFKRNWYDTSQIDGIELLNKCRDRHLFVIGNLPNFWDLDSAIFPLITFWVHIYERGRAWVFRRNRNPFTKDEWNRGGNEKNFDKHKTPYKNKNFVCEIHFDDWEDSDKSEYYKIRNSKRLRTEGQRAKPDRYKGIKVQRDAAIRYIFEKDKKMTLKKMRGIVPTLSMESIRLIKYG